MNLLGSSFFTVADRPTLPQGGAGAGPIIVWLQGEHDLSTDESLCRVLARAMALGSSGLVLDLSDVGFIAVSTIRVIVRAQQLLRHQSRPLTVRSPSRCARRVIGACGVDDLLGPNLEVLGTQLPSDDKRKGLGTWVEVLAAGRAAGGKQTTKLPESGGRLARSGR
ncbi:MAG TPA: STAS domain-containing protein [Acidimicrobiales bacterium]|nr:STAS domain-containing protein [Acidimicrobiales bacterium]